MSGVAGNEELGKNEKREKKTQSLLGGNIAEKFGGSSKDVLEEE